MHPRTAVYVYENGILIKSYRGNFRMDSTNDGGLILNDEINHKRYVIRSKGTIITETDFKRDQQ